MTDVLARFNVGPFIELLLRWFRKNGRDYPWRKTTDPYKIFVAEFMLQRTTPGHVVSVYEEFIHRYPTPEAATAAPDSEFKFVLRPLGLNRRTELLKRALERLCADYGGRIPSELEKLRCLERCFSIYMMFI